jgi:hypothetical protein
VVADLLALERWCNVLPDRIEEATNTLVKNVVTAMATNLIDHTPVDITTAVSNWQVSLNAPVLFELPAIVPGQAGSTAPASRAEALAHVKRALDDRELGEVTYLSNITPYLGELNRGTSKQEPAGFFERGVVVGRVHLATATLGITLK